MPIPHKHHTIGRAIGLMIPCLTSTLGFVASWNVTGQSFMHVVPQSVVIVFWAFTGIENAILADATVLAIRAEATRKPVAMTLKAQIQDAGGKIVGIALTHRHSYIPAFVYRFL